MKTATPPSPALHRALELREEGKSQRAIAQILAAEGVPLPPGRTRTWSQKAVERLFRRFEQPAPAASSPAPPAPTPPALLAADVDELATERQRWKELLTTQAGQNEELGRWVKRQEASEYRRRISDQRAALLPVLAALLLGVAITALYFTLGPPGQKLRTYQAAWDKMTPTEQGRVNKQLRGE